MIEGSINGSHRSDEGRLYAELVELSVETAPRRFAIGLLDVRHDDGVVLGWGLAFDDEAITYLPGECPQRLFRTRSADLTRRLLARRGDARLIWLDGQRPDA